MPNPELGLFIENISSDYGKELTLLFVSMPVFAMAFSVWVRKIIGRRDNWKCQEPGCDKSFQDGWMVHAAHYPEHHSKSDPLYDTPEAGDIRCIDHHQQQHERGTSLGRRGDDWAVKKLERTDRRTRKYRRRRR